MNERVLRIIDHLRISKSAFAQSIGVNPSVISHISSGRNKVGVDVLASIARTYSEISLKWLLTGEGAMIVKEQDSSDLKTDLRALRSHLNEMEAQLAVNKAQLELLIKKYS